jgi:hypothetical protein
MPGLCRFRMYMHKAVSRGLSGYDFKILQRALERLFLVGGRGLDTGTNGNSTHCVACRDLLVTSSGLSQPLSVHVCTYIYRRRLEHPLLRPICHERAPRMFLPASSTTSPRSVTSNHPQPVAMPCVHNGRCLAMSCRCSAIC